MPFDFASFRLLALFNFKHQTIILQLKNLNGKNWISFFVKKLVLIKWSPKFGRLVLNLEKKAKWDKKVFI